MDGSKLNDANEALKQALAIVRTEPRKAVELLESALERARVRSDKPGAALLAKHAGVVCEGLEDLSRANYYFNEALVADQQDVYLHVASADALRRLGDMDAARSALERALILANEQGDGEMADVAAQALARLDAEVCGH
jgi:tetratricopeptide (TPR) repeat protein